MVFRDREAALDSAYALMKAGFSVLKVEGPDGFQMRETALAAYQQSRRNKRSSG
jgi:crotonobetainyl-CoA:carnitine CoA-transferase CaiB-like acyl-CoA transferase